MRLLMLIWFGFIRIKLFNNIPPIFIRLLKIGTVIEGAWVSELYGTRGSSKGKMMFCSYWFFAL